MVCLSETHLDQTIPNHPIFDYCNKTIWRKDRNLHGGGVLIAVNDSIPAEPVLVDNTDNTEIIFIRIKESILLGFYYRPPMDTNIHYTYIIIYYSCSVKLKSFTLRHTEHPETSCLKSPLIRGQNTDYFAVSMHLFFLKWLTCCFIRHS